METSKDESVAKRPQMETQNAEQTIQELRMELQEERRVNQNLRAQLVTKDERIHELEQKNLKSPIMEPKSNMNLMELPNECLLEILGYLSNFEVLRKVALVSKRFYKLSQDQDLIRKIEVDFETWVKILEGKCCEANFETLCGDFFTVLNRSRKLTSFSFDFGTQNMAGEKFLEGFYKMNHQFLQELCIKGDGRYGLTNAIDFLNLDQPGNLLKIYLENCTTNLTVLNFEFKPQFVPEEEWVQYPHLSFILETISNFKLKSLQELQLSGVDVDLYQPDFKKLLERITENMPKLQLLCLTAEVEDTDEYGELHEYAEIFREFASGKNVKLEIRNVPVLWDFDGAVDAVITKYNPYGEWTLTE